MPAEPAVRRPAFPRPLFPRWSAAAVAVNNALLARAGQFEPTLAGEEWTVTPAPDLGEPCRPDLTIRLTAGDATLWLAVAGLDADALLDGLVTARALGELPEALRQAVVATALGGLLGRLERAAGRPLSAALVEPAPSGAAAGLRLPFRLRGRTSGATLTGWLLADAPALPWIASRLEASPPDPNRDWDRLTVSLPLVAGRTALPARDLDGLGLGDVVLLDQSFLGGGYGAFAPLGGGGGLMVEIGETAITVVDRRGCGMDEAAMAGGGVFADRSGGDMDGLEITLSFEVGALTLSLAELRSVGPGHVFAMPGDPARPVTIRVQGRAIGRGELVEIDGRLGVRVLGLVP